MIKILETNVDDQGYGGVYAFNLNIIKALRYKNNDLQFSICAFEPFESKIHLQSLEKDGIYVYDCWGGKRNFLFKQFQTCLKFYHLLRKEHIDCIHIHSDVAYKLFLYGLVAVMASQAKVLVHSHSTNIEGRHRTIKRYLQNICQHLLGLLPVTYLACSEAAADWMYCPPYNKKAIIIRNGIDTEKFRFDPEVRKSEREKLGLGDNHLVIGTVGRFSYQKNPEYILQIFEGIYQQNPNTRLLWIGEGNLKSDTIAEAQKLGIAEAIIFYGNSEHVERLYQAMDVFILPSRFEGLGIVAIEAQAAGLPSLLSNAVPKDAAVTDLAKFLPITGDVGCWVKEILISHNNHRDKYWKCVIDSGYDIHHTAKVLADIYGGIRN